MHASPCSITRDKKAVTPLFTPGLLQDMLELSGAGLQPFKNGCSTHAAADAHGHDSVSALDLF